MLLLLLLLLFLFCQRFVVFGVDNLVLWDDSVSGFWFSYGGGFAVRRSDWESMFQRGIRRGCGFIVTADERIREGKAVSSTDLSGSVFLPPSSSWYCRTLKKSRKIKSFFNTSLRFSLFISHLFFFLQYRIGWIQVEVGLVGYR